MGRSQSIPASEAKTTAYTVELPRPYDALGRALRDAYQRDQGLPEDIRILLRRLGRDFPAH